jgi:hypothetical protein
MAYRGKMPLLRCAAYFFDVFTQPRPFDAGSYGRVALYVFLGFGSWVGAALVERMLGSLAS